MPEMIVFPDVEAVLVAYLAPLGVPVSTQVRNPRPATFIRIRRIGGQRVNLVTDGAVVTFEAWADTEGAAADLGAQMSGMVWAMPDVDLPHGATVRKVTEVGGLTASPDPESESPRYTFTVRIDFKGAPAPIPTTD